VIIGIEVIFLIDMLINMITIKNENLNTSLVPIQSVSQTVNLYLSNKSINGFIFDFITFIPVGIL
jgi:hypothetical protein